MLKDIEFEEANPTQKERPAAEVEAELDRMFERHNRQLEAEQGA